VAVQGTSVSETLWRKENDSLVWLTRAESHEQTSDSITWVFIRAIVILSMLPDVVSVNELAEAEFSQVA
jgi:hypothetical protein